MSTKIFTAIGLMSGTSLDGIDLALIKSDGKNIIERKNFCYFPYDQKIKNLLKSLILKVVQDFVKTKIAVKKYDKEIQKIEDEFTLLHAKIVNEFLQQQKILSTEIDLIGFHGHTILHAPSQKMTWQIGNKNLLEQETKIKVINDFRTYDIAEGGQGAPLVPLYHFYLLSGQKKPIMVLNIGGVSNFTYFASDNEQEIIACDVCFGNAPFDDLIYQKLGLNFDENGELSSKGNPDLALAQNILQNEIFYRKLPKSFDRFEFEKILAPIKNSKNIKIEDALATYAFILARAIEINCETLSEIPKNIFVCGGGRKNMAIMNQLQKRLPKTKITSIDELRFNGDAIEAEAFAFLAIRRFLGLPIGISFRHCESL